MGNTPPKKISHKLEFYAQQQHHLQGLVPVYWTKSLPMTFIMKMQRISYRSRLYNLYQKIQDRQSSALLTLFGFKIQRGEGCAEEGGDRTVEYWEYLNYRFEEHIEDRTQRGVKFTYHQLWHVVQVVLTALEILESVGLIWEVHPAMLEVTPEGKLKANWSYLDIENDHLMFKKDLKFGRGGQGPWWSPEERWALQQRAIKQKIDHQKSNVYKLGLILLAMTNLNPKPVFNAQMWQQANKYEQPLPKLIDRCLNPDPNKRPSYLKILKDFQQYFNSSYELLISEGRRQDMHELHHRAQLMGQNRSSKYFTEVRQASRIQQLPHRQFRHTRLDTSNETHEQRLQALRDYRKSLVLQRKSLKQSQNV